MSFHKGLFYSYRPGHDYEAEPCQAADFDYALDDARIAQTPTIPRDACRLLVLNRTDGTITHHRFFELVDFLDERDLLVVNDTRVLPARLRMHKVATHGAVEVLLLKKLSETDERQTWQCLVKPGRSARVGQVLEAVEGAETTEGDAKVLLEGVVVAEEAGGTRALELRASQGSIDGVLHRIGEVPLPPYITESLADSELYQTVYARDEHSSAAPTAGLHFTDGMLDRIRARGIAVATVRLDVGLDTFRPVSVDDPRDHLIHSEYFCVYTATVEAINRTRRAGGRVVAVGTTTARALETAYQVTRNGRVDEQADTESELADKGVTLQPCAGTSGLFIVPGYRFGIVDALITNFHVPRSTLMMMVSAFAGRDRIMEAYAEACEQGYRFLSFGDAMLIE